MQVARIQTLLEPAINALGYEFWGCEFLSQGNDSILRIYIESEEGIGIDACQAVSRQVSAILEVEDPIPGHYTLEVSSPGIFRPLFKAEHFQRYPNAIIKVRIHTPLEERRNFRGKLLNSNEKQLTIRVDEEEFQLDIDNIEKAKIVSLSEK